MTIAHELAERITQSSWEALDALAIDTAKQAVADALACVLAGVDEPCVRVAGQVLGAYPASGPCRIFGTQASTGPLDAAFINGTACHALDFDDCNNTVGGHPTAPILFAVLALAEALGVSGRDVLVAYVTGFETMAKLGRVVHFHHYRKGWHPTATLGVFGATAACARLLQLDAGKTAQALCHTASLAAGLKANFGTMTKPLHVGYANRNGLFSAQLAAAGATAGSRALEHEHGFFEVYNGSGNYDVSRLLDVWGAPWDVATPGVAFKAYPCCGSTHPAIDAVLALKSDYGLEAAAVKHLHARTHERRLKHTNRPDPVSGLDAKFSVQYVMARALSEGRVGLAHFAEGAQGDMAVRRVMERISVEPHQDDNHFGAYVTLETVDGRSLSTYVPTPLGRDRTNPLPAERFRAKFDECCAYALAPDAVAVLWERIAALETLSDVNALTECLAGAKSSLSDLYGGVGGTIRPTVAAAGE